MKKEREGGESGVGGEVRGRVERNKISWEEKDDVIGQENIEDDKGEEKFGDDIEWLEEETGIGWESEDEKGVWEEECVIGRESWDEGVDRGDREMIGREEAAKGKSVGKGWEEDERAAGGAGSMTARSSLKLISHSSPSSKATPQMSSFSVETSWSLTTPSYHCRPNCIRTLRPMKR